MKKPEIEDMNSSQQRMYQRLIEILPDLNKRDQTIIHELLIDHILGISEDNRIQKILLHLGVEIENDWGSDKT
jgi:hypothetical protein